MRNILLFVLSFFIACQQSHIEKSSIDAKNSFQKKLVVCSQNLAQLGERKNRKEQERFLVDRILKAGCSLVALQEVSQRNPAAVEKLAEALSRKTSREFNAYIGKSRDTHITNGFLVAQDIGKVKLVKSYWNQSLPRINTYGPARNFLRGPLLLKLELDPKYQLGNKKNLEVISIHFKSKHDGWKDPAKMNFEIDRIESAEAIRKIAEQERNSENLVIVIGDRNNGKDRASDEVLEGKILVSDLAEKGKCQFLEDEIASCKEQRKPTLIGVFGLRMERYPGQYPEGSHKYRGEESLLDEAFMFPEDLGYITKSDNKLAIGYQGEYFKGSDHKLLYLELGKSEIGK